MIFTLGHSTLQKHEFIAAASGMSVVIDTRSHPGSRHSPQFGREQMEQWVPGFTSRQLRYEWWPELGGWSSAHAQDPDLVARMALVGVDISAYASGAFPRQRIGAERPGAVSGSLNPGEPAERLRPTWTNQGLWDYQFFTMLDSFQEAVDLLVDLYSTPWHHCALICCEAVWWKCHRSMIADHLYWRGVQCNHLPIKPPKRLTTRRFKPHAEAIGNRLQRYEPQVLGAWEKWRGSEHLVSHSA